MQLLLLVVNLIELLASYKTNIVEILLIPIQTITQVAGHQVKQKGNI